MKAILVSIFLFIWLLGCAQGNNLDSLKKAIILHKNEDTILAKMLYDYSTELEHINADSALPYVIKEINLARELKWNIGLVKGMLLLAHIQYQGNKLDEAVATSFQALKISEEMPNQLLMANATAHLSDSYRLLGDNKNAEFYSKKYLELARNLKNDTIVLDAMVKLSQLYSELGRWDEAEKIWPQALKLSDLQNDEISKVRLLETMGQRQVELNHFADALKYYKQVLEVWEKRKNYAAIAWIRCNLCRIYSKMHNKDSASYYGFSALTVAQSHSLKKETMNTYNVLANFFYEFEDYKQAFDFYLKFDSIYNSTYTMEAARNAEKIRLELEQEKKDAVSKTDQLKKDAATLRTKNLLYSAIGLFILLASFLLFNNRQKQKAKTKIEVAYTQLKSTQQQLIQSEKMASLGELTAGIAHEIQNPLNFVNNFSGVNNELIEELKVERSTLNAEEQDELLNDIFQNNEKINMHGKRADAIVKGMLQHSRQTSGKKEPTDINALCDEYLRLSFHGLRAKSKSFNANFKTDFDENVGKINIVSQDMGRVLLNLFNNAFYAVNEKLAANRSPLTDNYKPTVLVQTKRINDKVEIRVSDNGNGIPQTIIDKIFQPFFTTKPTGQGTGLGLSLSYDIITKEHSGTIRVNSKKDEGSEFIIELPLAGKD